MRLHLLFDIRRGFDLVDITHLNEHQPAQIFHDLACKRAWIRAGVESLVNRLQAVCWIVVHDGRDKIQDCLTRSSAKHRLCKGKRDLIACGRQLIEQGNRIAHAACRLAGNLNERVIVRLDLLGFEDGFELFDDLIHRDAAELVSLTAR